MDLFRVRMKNLISCFGLRKVLPEPWVWVKIGLLLVCKSTAPLGIWRSAGIMMRTWNLEGDSLTMSSSLFPGKSSIFHKQMIDQPYVKILLNLRSGKTKAVVAFILKNIKCEWTQKMKTFLQILIPFYSILLVDCKDFGQNQLCWECGKND